LPEPGRKGDGEQNQANRQGVDAGESIVKYTDFG
jgi:hypothetical protein